MDSFLQKQGTRVLQNEGYAYLLAAVLMILPFTSWISATIVNLVTLRKGYWAGSKVLGVVLLVGILIAQLFSVSLLSFCTMLLTFVISYLAANVLRVTANWNQVFLFEMCIAVLGLALVYWLSPEYVTQQYNELLNMLRQISKDNALSEVFNSKQPANQVLWANYTLGIRAFSIIFSGLLPLAVARFIQSILYYPGGFKNEVLNFRVPKAAIFLLLIIASAAYMEISLAISCLPLCVAYLAMAGMSLVYYLLAPKNGLFVLLVMIVPMLVLPYIALPVYVMLGLSDSLFNLRLYLSNKSGNDKE